MASVAVAYILWLFGGIFGLHHLYLNRPRHFFIWFATWGGMVLGWLSEAGRITEYVQETNQSPEYLKRLKQWKKASPKPEISAVFIGSSMMIGHVLSNLLISAVPEEHVTTAWYGIYVAHVLAALGASIGVHLVANMGPQEAPFLLPFLAAACTCPLSYFLHSKRPIIIVVCVFVAAIISAEHAQWRTKKATNDCVAYLKVIGFAICSVSIYASLWTSNMYFNVTVATLNGTVVPLRIVLSNFLQTRPMALANDVVSDIVPCLRMYGYETCQHTFFTRLAEISDPQRDSWAFNVLGFDKYPTQKQVNSHCRKLSSKWHPDRFVNADDEDKKEAEKKFIDIQKACGVLNRIKQKRERQNTWTTSDTENSDVTNDVDTQNDDVHCEDDTCGEENQLYDHNDEDIDLEEDEDMDLEDEQDEDDNIEKVEL